MSDSERAVEEIQGLSGKTYIRGGKYGPVWRLKPDSTPPAPPTNPGTALPPDPAALLARIDTLQAELNTTNSVNANLTASVTHLQAEFNTTNSVNTTRLQAELENLTTVVTQLATSVASLVQPEQVTPTPTTTATATPTMPSTPTATTHPLPCPPDPQHPRTIASGRGAASPEVFQEVIKTNWHGRLGRAHMVDVDALPASALMELDCLLRRKLHAVIPRGKGCSLPDVDTIFASLAALGLRLEDRGDYADLPVENDDLLRNEPTIRRGRNWAAACLTQGNHAIYWKGFVLETLIELARYRGLFDDVGFLRKES